MPVYDALLRVKVSSVKCAMTEFKLTDKFYAETLARAIDEVRFERRWKLRLSVSGDRCTVKLQRFVFPVTILSVDRNVVRILRQEGWVVWEAYQRRASAQEPLRRLIDELRFRDLLMR